MAKAEPMDDSWRKTAPLWTTDSLVPVLSHWGLSTGANRSENVAALASRAAASEDEIKV
jgi:hypothetical protein